ncbi:hypothetical protein CEXT_594861, partial [Caerostris extrusa]
MSFLEIPFCGDCSMWVSSRQNSEVACTERDMKKREIPLDVWREGECALFEVGNFEKRAISKIAEEILISG